MKYSEISPFYFPTSIALVDDSPEFLANASLALDGSLAFCLFKSPLAALLAVNGGEGDRPPLRNLFSLYRTREDEDESRHVIDINLGLIHREIHNERRFENFSVVVVDHDMPEMNGLEFCRSIHNPLVKKILLTGKADERVAVKAFNEGIIDRFIRKQDEGAMNMVNEAVVEMQALYFRNLERMLSDALSVGSPRFLNDRHFAVRFAEIRKELGIVEYYLTCQPDGMLMLDAVGRAYLLIVHNEERVRADYEIAFDQGAPNELLSALRSGAFVPHFWKTRGNYSPIYENWRDYLHPASEFQGNEWYCYAILKNPNGFKLSYLETYADYLERLDDSARAALGG